MAKAREQEARDQEADLDEGAGLRVYELGFHLDPELPVEGMKRAYQEMRAHIAMKSAVIAEGEPEKVPLAYTISRQETSGRRDFDSAYFSWIVYEAMPPDHAEVIAAAHADKRIIRFIDFITTKDAARHAAEMRAFSQKHTEPEHSEESGIAAGAELDAALENVVI